MVFKKVQFEKSERVLILGICGIIIAFIIQGTYFAHYIDLMAAKNTKSFIEHVNSLSHVSMANSYLSDLRIQTSIYSQLNSDERHRLLQDRAKIKSKFDQALKEVHDYIEICDEKEKRIKQIEKFTVAFQNFWENQEKFFSLENEEKTELAWKLLIDKIDPEAAKASQILASFITEEHNEAQEENKHIVTRAKKEIIRLYLLVALIAALSLVYLLALVKLFGKYKGEKEKQNAIHENRMQVLAMTAANIGHEILNPVTVVMSRAERMLKLFEQGQYDFEKAKKDFHQILAYCRRIVKTVHGLKNLSRKDDDIDKENESLLKIMEESLDLIQYKIKKSGVEIRMTQEVPDIRLYCHPVQISQVIINLLSNAIDAIKEQNQPWIEINCQLQEPENSLLIQVTDSGAGIDAETAKKIMEPFFTTKKRGEGTGIGLSICVEVIKNHGGVLRVDTHCKNTRFEVIIPIAQGLNKKLQTSA